MTPGFSGTTASAGDETPGVHGHIKSYVRRRGHISPAQERHFVEGLPRWGIPYAPALLDPTAAFGRAAPLWLEIGFGMGETTAQLAAAHPDVNYLGLEIFTAGVGALLKQIDERQLTNIRIISHDAVEVLAHMLAPASVDRVLVYFPDPWPKLRHHKRRLIQAPFVAALSRVLKPGGLLHCATDWQHYAEQMLSVLSAQPDLHNTATGFAPRPAARPLTKFERRGVRLGHGVWDVMFSKSLPRTAGD
ncbi:MAG: tRNA (guanosine(46)-N7)-methyltransferase TrmB [Burkholderiaceae bacterium]|jgi:tRNA (guanine-N7-)-methyltransferase